MSYASIYDVKTRYPHLSSQVDIQDELDAASDFIDTYCGRTFTVPTSRR